MQALQTSILARLMLVVALAFSFSVPVTGAAHAKQATKTQLKKFNGGYRVSRGTWQPLRNRKRSKKSQRKYFIQFRARNAKSYGHTSVITGKLRRGKIPKRRGRLIKGTYKIAGLAPKSNSPAVYMMGHLVPLPASTGWTDGDDEDAYLLDSWQINLTYAEYKQVNRLIERRKRASKFWNAAVYACVHFTADIAKDIGLRAPRGFYIARNWVGALKRVNRNVR